MRYARVQAASLGNVGSADSSGRRLCRNHAVTEARSETSANSTSKASSRSGLKSLRRMHDRRLSRVVLPVALRPRRTFHPGLKRSVVLGGVPARRAAALDPVDALRYE